MNPSVRITEEALAELRERVGSEIEIATRGHITEITVDAIRHWAYGVGDRNPLWLDEDGKSENGESRVAPPTIILAFSKLATGYAGGLPGVHALYTGSDYTWMRPLRLGDRLRAHVVLDGVIEREGQYAGRSFNQVARITLSDQTEAVVAEGTSSCLRTERDAAKDRGKNRSIQPYSYSEEELDEIWQMVDTEERTGSNLIDVSKLEQGQEIPTVVKGPLTITDNMMFALAWGGSFMRSHGFARDYYLKHPGAFSDNEHGFPDFVERVHWDTGFAKQVGVEAPYDYGGQRYAWMGHLVTNWMGDYGMLKRLNVQFRRFNIIGDTTWCRGKIEKIYRDNDADYVDLEIWAHDQRDEVTTKGSATVCFPSTNSRHQKI